MFKRIKQKCQLFYNISPDNTVYNMVLTFFKSLNLKSSTLILYFALPKICFILRSNHYCLFGAFLALTQIKGAGNVSFVCKCCFCPLPYTASICSRPSQAAPSLVPNTTRPLSFPAINSAILCRTNTFLG